MPINELIQVRQEIEQDPQFNYFSDEVGVLGAFYEVHVLPYLPGEVGLVRDVGIGSQFTEPLAIAAVFPQAKRIECSDVDTIQVALCEDMTDALVQSGRRTIARLRNKIRFATLDASSVAHFPSQEESTVTIIREIGGKGADKQKILDTLVEITEPQGLLVVTTLVPLGGVSPMDEQAVRNVLSSMERVGRVKKIVDEDISPPLQVRGSNDGHMFIYQVT